MAPPLRGFSSDAAFPSPCPSVGLGSILCEQKKLLVRRQSVAMGVDRKEKDDGAEAAAKVGSFAKKKAMEEEEDRREEEVVWKGKEAESSKSSISMVGDMSVSSSSSCGGHGSCAQYRAVSACRMIPQRSRRAMEAEEEEEQQQKNQKIHHHIQSAPVQQVPLWAKFMMEKEKGKANGVVANGGGKANGGGESSSSTWRGGKEGAEDGEEEGCRHREEERNGDGERGGGAEEEAAEEAEEEEGERLPPHEFLARQYARSQRATFSVCEGQGRTLKGRDLSRVRNAVWSKMGFAD